MKRSVILLIAICALAGPALCAEPDRGRPEITLSAGRQGDVRFPHARHEDTLPDCTACHRTYPEEKGAIEKLAQDGKLKPQQVMKECIGCHRQRKKDGLSFGPLSCKDCHHKSGE
ncbi:MAG: cytochrome c3 family protein [Thermodesulfobacteriota bacterium]